MFLSKAEVRLLSGTCHFETFRARRSYVLYHQWLIGEDVRTR
jgi:hypothetical protein